MMSWVIKYDNGYYNRDYGHESHFWECTKYTTKEHAEKVAEELCGVHSVFQISDEKHCEDQAVLIVSDLLNAGLIQNEQDDFNHAVNIVIKRLKLINDIEEK